MKCTYKGQWPALCLDILYVQLEDGTEYEGRINSGGIIELIDDEWEVEQGEWEIEMPEDFPSDRLKEVLSWVNSEIPWGCCGGCA